MLSKLRMGRSNPKSPALSRPRQVVILAGGRGTRLRPLTDTRPKPMIEFHGKPFLEYLIEMLRDQGFEKVLLLLGYLPEVIMNHFGDGSKWGIRVDYSVSDADDLTVRRVQLAEEKIDERFLLMYCDNYWPMQMNKMWQRYLEAQVPAMVTVYRNEDQYSKDSVYVDDQGYLVTFDRSRTTPGLQGVEISYAILDKSVLEHLPKHDELFEQALYPQLAKEGKLAAYVSDHRYYSVGSLQRLALTEAFFARRPTVILDRDGVLNRKPPKAQYVRNWGEFEWLPGAVEAVRLLKKADYRVIVVSNQAGIGRGFMSENDLTDIHERMKSIVGNGTDSIDAFYYCPHHWDEGCDCRKPKPGMLFQAQRDFSLDLTRTPFIGDDVRDLQAADSAGCPGILVSEENPLLTVTQQLLNGNLKH